ncbi:MAG: hypothetical protein ACYDFU_08960 [Nitrospirota bacterium]
MPDHAEILKKDIREILGDLPSDIFLSRIDKAIDAADADPEKLKKAADRVAGMVRLFIGLAQAEQIRARCQEIFTGL